MPSRPSVPASTPLRLGRPPEAPSPRPLLVAAALWGALILGIGLPSLADANGGTLRLANVPMGGYLVSVFTDPTPVRPDSLDVSVLAVLATTGEVAEGLEVELTTRHLEGQAPPATRPATRDEADDPRYYAAKFGLGAEGEWEVEVRVQGEAGEGSARFELNAREPGLFGHPGVLILLALLPLLLVGGWILRQGTPSAPENG